MTGTDKKTKKALNKMFNHVNKIIDINNKVGSLCKNTFIEIIKNHVNFMDNPNIHDLLQDNYYILGIDYMTLDKSKDTNNKKIEIKTYIEINIMTSFGCIIIIELHKNFSVAMRATVYNKQKYGINRGLKEYNEKEDNYTRCKLDFKAQRYFRKIFNVIEYVFKKFKYNINDNRIIYFNDCFKLHTNKKEYYNDSIDGTDFIKLLECDLYTTDINIENKLIVKNQNVTCQDLTKNICDYLF